ncbi:MAG: hypothetical protein HY735_24655 [Verrucomicrobia bacterium]|nr:hypothetical protein [Verrucomicrobiota bacterium]
MNRRSGRSAGGPPAVSEGVSILAGEPPALQCVGSRNGSGHVPIPSLLRTLVASSALAASLCLKPSESLGAEPPSKHAVLQKILETTKPLPVNRGDRLPLFVWAAMDVGTSDENETLAILRALAARGIGAITSWNPQNKESSLREALRIAQLQRKLGLEIHVNATSCLHQFFNGDERTAHVTKAGERFFDLSFDSNVKIGCPFALDHRRPVINEQMDYFARAYHERGLGIDFIFADWEIDGPIEWNGAWQSSRRCQRCRDRIRDLADFTEFQKVTRTIRSELQREAFADTLSVWSIGTRPRRLGIPIPQ